MKHKFLLFAALVYCMCATAENLVIQTMDSQEKFQAIETFGRLAFDHEQQQVLLILKDSTVAETFSMDEVHKFYFTERGQGFASVIDDLSIEVNGNELVVNGLSEPMALRVFSVSGQLLMQKDGFSVDVTSLPNGAYLLQCKLGIVKFVKQ